MNKTNWLKKIKFIEKLNDEDQIKLESYSVIVSFLLSKDVFKHNTDLKKIMCEFGIECKPYLLKNRTAIMGKAIRKFQQANSNEILIYLEKVRKFLDELEPDEEKIEVSVDKKNKDNYMKKMLDLYGRKG